MSIICDQCIPESRHRLIDNTTVVEKKKYVYQNKVIYW